MTLHSALGASSAHRWLKCPGSFRLSERAPKMPPTIHSATGTLAHRLIEGGLRSGGGFVADLKGNTLFVNGYPDPIEVTQDLIDGVLEMINYVEGKIAGSTWYDFEFRVSLDQLFKTPPPVSVFGTLDAATLVGVELEVIDYKNGAGVFVSPIENPQLMFYAAGAMVNLPVGAVQRVKMTIVQPHAPGAEKIRSWTIDPVDLSMWVNDVLVPGVAACNDPNAPLVTGAWCRWCPVSQACPALHAAAVDLAQKQFDDVDAPGDPNDLASLLDTAEKAELWIARLREFAKAALEGGTLIPGWGLIPTRPTRKWLMDDQSIAARLIALGLDPTTVFDNRLRSPAQIDTILHKSRAGTKLWDDVNLMVESRSSGTRVGRTGPTAKDEFNDGEPT